MAFYIELLGCKFISEAAREELQRAACPIHKEVPGLDTDIEIVELHHAGWEKDRSGMSVWGVVREIQILSLGLYLAYQWDDEANGYALTLLDEDARATISEQHVDTSGDELDDLDRHPF